MIYNNVLLVVTNVANIDEVKKHLVKLATQSLLEPGCARFDLFHSESQPELFMLIEQWASQEELDAHREAEAFQQIYVPHVIPLVERMPHTCEKLAPPEQLIS